MVGIDRHGFEHIDLAQLVGPLIEAAALATEGGRIGQLRDRLWTQLESLGGATINGDRAPRVPHILNVSFDGLDGEALMTALPGLAVSTGAACNSALGEPSYVLRALGRTVRQAESALRFSFGRFTTEAEIDGAAALVCRAVRALRAVSPEACGPPPVTALPAQEGVLSPLAEDCFSRLGGAGVLTDGPGRVLHGEAGRAAGDAWVRLHLRVLDDTVIEARFQALGCPHTLVTASWRCLPLSELDSA